MSKRLKILIISLTSIIIVAIYFVPSSPPPADSNSDRIVYRLASSFPGATGIFVNYDIYVSNIDEPGLTRITGLDDDWSSGPAWSPNGNKIAYTWKKGLYVTNADGVGQHKLLWEGSGERFPLHPAWSPDGKQIVFTNVSKLHVVDVETRKIIRLGDDTIRGYQPSWSPDGNKIVFRYLSPASHNFSTSSIAVIDINGLELVQLTPEDGSGEPEWSPDGSEIVFTRDHNIYLMKPDGTGVEVIRRGDYRYLHSTLRHEKGIKDKSFSPTWSPDGKRLAFVTWPLDRCNEFVPYIYGFCYSELRIMDADGSNEVVLKSSRNKNIAFPEWAP